MAFSALSDFLSGLLVRSVLILDNHHATTFVIPLVTFFSSLLYLSINGKGTSLVIREHETRRK